MGEMTKIEWCHHTFNPWIGCTKVAPECAHCYAEELMAKRWKKVEWGDKGERKRSSTWRDPLKWNKAAEKAGERRRIEVLSNPEQLPTPSATRERREAR